MSDLNSQTYDTTEFPAFTTRDELELAILSMSKGQTDVHNVLARLGNTDLTGITNAATTGRPALDYTA